jgi:hypothetical protein
LDIHNAAIFYQKYLPLSSGTIFLQAKKPNKKTGLGAEGEEKAILPSPVDCFTYFYNYCLTLSRKKFIFGLSGLKSPQLS